MSAFEDRDIVYIKDFSKKELLEVLEASHSFEKKFPGRVLDGKIIATLFFEPSTRTRLSFESAANRLGAKVIGFHDWQASSAVKGETLWDTIRTVDNYCDLIVLRHPQEGAAKIASEAAGVPVINAGDGSNEHPTQAMIDLYTIQKALGKIDGIKIGFLGDLKYGRTVHSLCQALSHFKTTQYFISPKELCLPRELLREVKSNGTAIVEDDNIEKYLSQLDVLYVTRVQKERFSDSRDYERYKDVYKIDKKILAKAKANLKIMHPFPRVHEISKDVDESGHALYFEQIANGVFVRQALLAMVLGAV